MYLTGPLLKGVARIKRAIAGKQGLCTILGDIGLGKSSLLRYIAVNYGEENYAVSFLPDVQKCKTSFEFLKLVSRDFGVEAKRSRALQLDAIEEMLVKNDAAGKTSIIFIDEGQKLPLEILDLIRSLLNYETDTHKLAQFVIAGQLELQESLVRPKLAAFRSRVVANIVMQPLSLPETKAMIDARLAGWDVEASPFTDAAVATIHATAFGVPRRILLLCRQSCDMASFETSSTESGDWKLDRKVVPDDVAEANRLLQVREEQTEDLAATA